MRLRIVIAFGLAAALLAPGARAEHCPVPIYLFSYLSGPVDDPLDANRKLGSPTVTSSAIGCLIIAEDIPETPGDESDTDYIYPGSNTLVVRWLEGELPASGTLAFAGEIYDLAFYATTNGLTAVTDSKQILIDPVDSVIGGDAVITVCREQGEQFCETRTYRTIA